METEKKNLWQSGAEAYAKQYWDTKGYATRRQLLGYPLFAIVALVFGYLLVSFIIFVASALGSAFLDIGSISALGMILLFILLTIPMVTMAFRRMRTIGASTHLVYIPSVLTFILLIISVIPVIQGWNTLYNPVESLLFSICGVAIFSSGIWLLFLLLTLLGKDKVKDIE